MNAKSEEITDFKKTIAKRLHRLVSKISIPSKAPISSKVSASNNIYLISYDRDGKDIDSHELQAMIKETIKDGNGIELWQKVRTTILFKSSQDYAYWVTKFNLVNLTEDAFLIFVKVEGSDLKSLLIRPNPILKENA